MICYNTVKGTVGTKTSVCYNDVTLGQTTLMRMFVSPVLAAQTLPIGQTIKINMGISEDDASCNFYLRAYVYVGYDNGGIWTKRAEIAGPTNSVIGDYVGWKCVEIPWTLTEEVEISDSDRIIVEIWGYTSPA